MLIQETKDYARNCKNIEILIYINVLNDMEKLKLFAESAVLSIYTHKDSPSIKTLSDIPILIMGIVTIENKRYLKILVSIKDSNLKKRLVTLQTDILKNIDILGISNFNKETDLYINHFRRPEFKEKVNYVLNVEDIIFLNKEKVCEVPIPAYQSNKNMQNLFDYLVEHKSLTHLYKAFPEALVLVQSFVLMLFHLLYNEDYDPSCDEEIKYMKEYKDVFEQWPFLFSFINKNKNDYLKEKVESSPVNEEFTKPLVESSPVNEEFTKPLVESSPVIEVFTKPLQDSLQNYKSSVKPKLTKENVEDVLEKEGNDGNEKPFNPGTAYRTIYQKLAKIKEHGNFNVAEEAFFDESTGNYKTKIDKKIKRGDYKTKEEIYNNVFDTFGVNIFKLG